MTTMFTNDRIVSDIENAILTIPPQMIHDPKYYGGFGFWMDEDNGRIKQVFQAHGFDIDDNTSYAIWISRSNAWFAAWMNMPEDDHDLWLDICKYWVYALEPFTNHDEATDELLKSVQK